MNSTGVGSLRYAFRGQPGAPLVVWLHGFMGGAEDWLPVVDALGGVRSHLLVDLPGHGGSGIAPDLGFDALADELAALADRFAPPPWSIAGYSMGGRIALCTALRHADWFGHVLIESATAGIEGDVARAERTAADEAFAQELEQADFASVLRRWYERPLFATLHRTPGLVSGLIDDRLSRHDPKRLAAALRRFGTASQPSLWDALADAQAAALFICGAADAKFDALAQRMADLWGARNPAAPRSRLVRVPGVGHNVHLEAPTSYIGAVHAFLEP